MVELANRIWEDGPVVSPSQPPKQQIRAWGTQVEDQIEALIANAGGITLPDRVIAASNIGGTANAILASSDRAVTGVAYQQLITVNFTAANTGPMTISIIGETPRPLVLNVGSPIPAGYVSAGMSVLVQIDSAGNYRLFSYGDSAAIQAAVEAVLIEAEAARDAALGAVPNAFSATRAAMAALPGTIVNAYLTEDGFNGQFSLAEASNYADLIAANADGEVIASTVDLTKAWVRRRTPDMKTVDFKAFGAAGGANDDTTLWNAMMTRLASSTWDAKKVIIPPGNFTLADAQVKSGVHIELMAGARVASPDRVSGTAKQVFTGTGSLGAGIALSSDSPIDLDYVTVAAGGAGFVPTEYVLVQSDNYVSGTSGRNQEVMRVLSSTNTKITFTRPLTTAFLTSDNAKIYHLTPLLGAKISGQGEIVAGSNQYGGIYLIYPVNCLIEEGVTVRNARDYGSYVFDTGFDSHVRGVSAYDGAVQTAGLGYGVSFGASTTFCTVESCYFENVRENPFTNRSRWCEFRFNTVVKGSDNGVNSHGSGCDHITISDNVIRDCAQGIVVGQAGGGRSDNNILVQNNRLYNCVAGISLSAKTGETSYGNAAKGNTIENCGGSSRWGIQAIYQGKSFAVDGNIIKDMVATTVNAINIDTCSDGSVSKNTVLNHSNTSGSGLSFNAASKLSVSGNVLEGVLGTPFFVRPSCSDMNLSFNSVARGGSNSISAGAVTEKYNSWN